VPVQSLTVAACEFLTSPSAQQALEELELPSRAQELAFLSSLRRRFAAAEAGWLLAQLQLRARARGRLPGAEGLLYEPEALEMLSAAEVATWRAERVQGLARACLDLGAGAGGDCFALARAGLEVDAVELDPVRARLLEHNLRVLGLEGRVRVRVADWTATSWAGAEAAFVDPARRIDGVRVLGLEAMRPPLSAVLELAREVPAVWLKVAPGFDRRELPAEAGLEFVSLAGELKEALLTFGAACRPGPRAVLLPERVELVGDGDPKPNLGEPGAWLYEPDPAVIRAGLVRTLGVQLGAHQLDPHTAYLSGPEAQTPFARGWRVARWGGFSLKVLKRWLREEGVGSLEVKRRRSPVEPATLQRQVGKLKGGRRGTVFLTPVAERPAMLLAVS